VLTYLDSSILARAYLADEPGHDVAAALLADPDHLLVTATWTVVEVTSALVRASRAARTLDLPGLLALLDADTGPDWPGLLALLDADTGEAGPVTLLRAEQRRLEARTLEIVREHALRSLDALHLAVADVAARPLADLGTAVAFASRDDLQRRAATALGFELM
jgi:uncharacterized protein